MHKCRILMLAVLCAPLCVAAADATLSGEDVRILPAADLLHSPDDTPADAAVTKADATQLVDVEELRAPNGGALRSDLAADHGAPLDVLRLKCQGMLQYALTRWKRAPAKTRFDKISFGGGKVRMDLSFVAYPIDEPPTEKRIMAFCRCARHARGFRNVLYSDGQVEWLSREKFLAALKADAVANGISLGDSPEKTKEHAESIDTAIGRLADDDFDTRQQAALKLYEFGEKARLQVEAGARSDNAEISDRCRRILDTWKRFEQITESFRDEFNIHEKE